MSSKSATQKNPVLEHDTGKVRVPVTVEDFDGQWVRTSDSVRLKVKNGSVALCNNSSAVDIVWKDGKYIIDGRYELLDFTETLLKWIDTKTGTLYFWIKENAYSLVELVQQLSIRHETSTGKTPQETKKPNDGRDVDTKEIERKVKLLNSIRLPELKDPEFLSSHITTIDTLCRSYQLISENVVPTYLEIGLCSKFIETLKETDKVHQTSLTFIRNRGHNWNLLKSTLLKTYCSREVLQAAYRRRATALQFKHTGLIAEFLLEITTLHSMIKQIYGTSTETSTEERELIHEILRKLPELIRREVIKTLRNATRLNTDWELAVPFESSYKNDHEVQDVSFCSILESECLASNSSFLLAPTRLSPQMHSDKTSPLRGDRVSAVRETSVKEPQSEWYISGDLPPTKLLEELGFTNIRTQTSKRSGKDYILAHNNSPQPSLESNLASKAPKCYIAKRLNFVRGY